MRHTEVEELFARLGAMQTTVAREAVERRLRDERFADPRLERYGYRVYSQSDEDGIIAEIFRRIGTTDRRFVEIGVGNGLENNTCYLLTQQWPGAWIEADARNCVAIEKTFHAMLRATTLQVRKSFVTRENVNETIASCGLDGEIDLASIDIDGNDYYVFGALEAVKPRVVAIEYNAAIHPPASWVQTYDPRATWNGGNAFGASLCALAQLAQQRGYDLVGTGLLGINAFFVRHDLAEGRFAPPSPQSLFNPPLFDLIPAFHGGHPPSIRL